MRLETLKKLLSKYLPICLAGIILLCIYVNKAFADTSPEEIKLIKLEKKIATSYSRKFCNAIGMGMSRESSLKLAIDENSNPKFNSSLWIELAISGDKNINNIEEEKLISLISNDVVDKCGYPLGLEGEKGSLEFSELLKNELNALKKNT